MSRANIHPETTLARAYLLMENLKCHNLPVVSEDRVVGVIAERDINHLITVYSQGLQGQTARLTVGNYMKGPVKKVDEHHALEAVLRMMLDQRVGAVVIEREGVDTACITRDDMLEILADIAKESKTKVIDHFQKILNKQTLKNNCLVENL